MGRGRYLLRLQLRPGPGSAAENECMPVLMGWIDEHNCFKLKVVIRTIFVQVHTHTSFKHLKVRTSAYPWQNSFHVPHNYASHKLCRKLRFNESDLAHEGTVSRPIVVSLLSQSAQLKHPFAQLTTK